MSREPTGWRAGIEWDDTPSSEIDPLCGGNQIRLESTGMAYWISPGDVETWRSPNTHGFWGRLRPMSELPEWAKAVTL